MKLIRYGAVGLEEPGVAISDGRRIDAGGEVDDYDERFFAAGGLGLLSKWVSAGCPGGREVDPLVRLGPPVARPSKIVCIGRNYLDHAMEMGGEIPVEPTVFMKASSAWSGPNDDVVVPRGSTKLDYEVELAVVIGKSVSYVNELDAMACVASHSGLHHLDPCWRRISQATRASFSCPWEDSQILRNPSSYAPRR